MVFVLLLILTVTVPAFASVQHENVSLCRIEEYNCSNGQCIGLEHVCDGIPDCLDGTDEKTCGGYADTALGNKRDKRQSQQRCRSGQWQCRDRSCINFDGVCDGVVDCRDHSDETFALCRNTTCQSNWFRCTYGACVDGTAPCNDLQECADNSDELLPRCRNDTNGSLGQYFCANGQVIPSTDLCDGVQNCLDGTDETLRACADKLCPSYLFQCAYGACVDNGSGCNGVVDCADGSDESAELCRPNEVVAITTTTAAPPVSSEICVLPEYPLHGSYSVGGDAKARPGQLFQTAFLSYSCSAGYGLENDLSFVYCNHGTWNTDFPKCIRLCRLNKHPGVEYRCLLTGNRGEEGSRECNVFEPTGTVAQPSCNKPNYYSKSFLSLMRCQDGSWDKDPICEAGLENGTNITIVVKDSVQIYVSQFQYVDSVNPNSNDSYSHIPHNVPITNINIIRNNASAKPIPLSININNAGSTVNLNNVKSGDSVVVTYPGLPVLPGNPGTRVVENDTYKSVLDIIRPSVVPNTDRIVFTDSSAAPDGDNYVDQSHWRIGTETK